MLVSETALHLGPELERADIVQKYVSSGTPLTTATRRAGWSEQEREDMEGEIQQEQLNQASGLGTALLNAQSAFDQEGN